jgi:hypothetical protein
VGGPVDHIRAVLRAAAGTDTGRVCPYCRFPFKHRVQIAECWSCHAPHHEECWLDNAGCAVVACAAAPPHLEAGGVSPTELLPRATVQERLSVGGPREGLSIRTAATRGKVHQDEPRAGRNPALVVAVAVAVAAVALAAVTIIDKASNSTTSSGPRAAPSSGLGRQQQNSPPTRGTTRGQTGPATPDAAAAVTGSWEGVVTQYAPSGTRQRISITSEITDAQDGLVGSHSELTVAGQGVGQRCAGGLRERSRDASIVSFDYKETLNPSRCITHTIVSLTPEGSGVLAYRETYETGIGPGRLVGRLVKVSS